jgi:hypothetical protein
LPAEPPVDITLSPPAGEISITGHPPTVISLDREAERERLSVADHVALQDANLRQNVAYWTIGTFIGANLMTLFALGYLAWMDQSNIASKLIAPGDRIITSQVFMALLGATTVQVGAIMVIITRYLFPGRS